MSNTFITRQDIVIVLHDLIDGAKEVHINVCLPLWEHKYETSDSASELSTESTVMYSSSSSCSYYLLLAHHSVEKYIHPVRILP